MKRVVTIGGGTGSYTVLSSIKNIEGLNISAIVAMTDDGGSTGVLRDELGVLPPGDIRQCLTALSEESGVFRKLMSYRFEEGALRGHSFGNIFLAGLEKVSGSFAEGVEICGKILKIKGRVLPVTNNNVHLHARLNNGVVLEGENEINHFDISKIGLEHLYFSKDTFISQSAREAIENADYILIGPGNQYCSILPCLLPVGIKESFANSNAKIIYIANLTNKKGHSLNFNLSNYVTEIENYINKKIDVIFFNKESPTNEQISYYELAEGDGVIIKNDMHDDIRVKEKNLLSHKLNMQNKTDKVASVRSYIRHDIKKLEEEIKEIVS